MAPKWNRAMLRLPVWSISGPLGKAKVISHLRQVFAEI
jgi:hypothetical protein